MQRGFVREYIRQLHDDHIRNNKRVAWTTVLALFVVLTVVWSLHGTGISMVNETDCGIEEHQHTDNCYEDFQICGMREGDKSGETYHIHNDSCYEIILTCEKKEHLHTVACVDVDTIDNTVIQEDIVEERTELDDVLGDIEIKELSEDILPEPVQEKITIEEPIVGVAVPDPTQQNIREMIHEYVIRNGENIVPGRIYVVTATGVRDKDEVHEYLETVHISPANVGSLYNNGYIKNADNDTGRFIAHTNLPLALCVFRSQADMNSSVNRHYIYQVDPDNTDNVVSTVRNYDVNDVSYDGKFVNAEFAMINFNRPYDHINYRYNYGTGTNDHDDLYIYVRPDNGRGYDHADIEITDGGFFQITTKRVTTEGYQEIVTKYDSYVSEVDSCKIYGNENESWVLGQFVSSDYEPINEKGQTQYELTSKYLTSEEKRFSVQDADHAVFTLKIKLAPMSSTVYTYDNETDRNPIKNSFKKDYANEDGSFNYIVKPIEVSLGRQSILDALNKCPDHSGLDFNLLYKEIYMEMTQPTELGFELVKNLNGFLTDDYKSFSFELLDESGNTVLETVQPDSTGKIHIPAQDFPIPGTYKYKIREKILPDAVQMEKDVYYKNNVKYDGRVLDVVVDVKPDPSIPIVLGVTENMSRDEILAAQNRTEKLDDGSTRVNATLIATVKYYYEGEELTAPVNFTNYYVEYDSKNLKVNKVWRGDSKDRITFRIIQIKNGTERSFYDVGGNTIFEITSSTGWERTFKDLPVKVVANGVTDTYEYEVQELKIDGYTASYKMTEDEELISFEITNTDNSNKELELEKQWADEEGNILDWSNPGAFSQNIIDQIPNSIFLNLHRRYREVEIPVKVYLQSSAGGSDYSQQITMYGYKGGSIQFQLESLKGVPEKMRIASSSRCNCTQNADTKVITIDHIDNNAVVVLQYNQLTSSDLLLWHTDNNGFILAANATESERWRAHSDGNRSALISCGSEFTNASYTRGSGTGENTGYKIINRTANWDQAQLRLSTTKYVPGERYSFSAYVMFSNQFTPINDGNIGTYETLSTSDISRITRVKLQLVYTDANGDVQYLDIASRSEPQPYNWYHLEISDFMIPKDATNVYLAIQLEEPERTNAHLPDIYFDDVIIAPVTYKVDVDRETGSLKGSKEYESVNERVEIVPAAKNWLEDETFAEQYINTELANSSDWKKKHKLVNTMPSPPGTGVEYILEDINREYEYYVVEAADNIPANFKVSYDNNNVSNTTDGAPILVTNRYCAYQLPHTGGTGTNKIRLLGLLILLGGITLSLLNEIRKRGRPSG